jgi:tryptophanyl-tRNA synthetase
VASHLRQSLLAILKKDVAALAIETLTPIRLRYEELLKDPGHLKAVALRGSLKAAEVAGPVYHRAAHAMGLL